MSEGTQRRLAAIVSVDVVGYSRLMGADESGTLEVMHAHRKDLWDPIIERFGGHVVGTAGDSILAEFASAVAAVESSIAVQQGMVERNAGLSNDKRMLLRIGINIGEVILADDDIFGDGVNVAARLQEIAVPGGLAVSGNIHEQVEGKVEAKFDDDGMHEVKNIVRPLEVWRWSPLHAESAQSKKANRHPAPPDKPSIAVLPFVNMSGDPEQEFFADGITEDIITELARYPGLFVIARNSTFTYKGQPVRIQDVGRELGVIYLVEGSVRKSGSRVRVTVQLIEAATENHIWAERYDRELSDIFEIQDELTRAIAGALPARLEAADIDRIKRKPPQDLAAYDYVLRSKILHHVGTKEANAEALDVLDKAIEVDPDYAQAYAWKACTLRQAVLRGYAEDPDVAGEQRVENARKALALDENDMECLRILCEINMEQLDLAQAELYHNRAFAINPNDPRMAAQRGELMTWMGRHTEGIEWVETAMRLDPLGANAFSHLLGRALHGERRYAEAIKSYRQVGDPRYQHHADMAACHAQMGNVSDVEREVTESLRLKPDFSIESYLSVLPYENPIDRDHHREGLRKAGLPN
jgi:adenylate cyclase